MKLTFITMMLSAILTVATVSVSSAQTSQEVPENVNTLLRELINGEQLKQPKSRSNNQPAVNANPPTPAAPQPATQPPQSATTSSPRTGSAAVPGNTAGSLPAYQTAVGIQCVESWITTTLQRINGLQTSASFNAVKPYRLNRFGFIFGTNARSNYEPDNWADFGASRNAYMWNYLYTSEQQYPVWRSTEYNTAGVPGLRFYVNSCINNNGAPAATPIPAPSTPQLDPDAYQSAIGSQCIESWITTSLQLINGYNDDSNEFNSRKPFRLNRFGFIFGSNARSNFEPDNWPDYGAARNSYMWNYLYTSDLQYPRWRTTEYNSARVPGLRFFVSTCLQQATGGSATNGSAATNPQTPPFQSARGIQCLESWISNTLQRLNGYSGSAGFNENKPYRVNRFGFIFGRNARSNYEPDNWADYGASRNSYMWNYLYSSEEQYPIWRSAEYNAAGVIGLRPFVNQCLAGNTVIAQAPQTPTQTPTTPPVKPTATPAQTTRQCRTTEWGEEVCDEVVPAAPVDTAAADAAIDRVNQSRPQTQAPGESGDDGISIARPSNPDTTWTADDPRNDSDPIVTARRGRDNEPGIAEEFGDPSQPGFSDDHNPHGRPDTSTPRQCKARGNGCHLKPDGSGCHCPDAQDASEPTASGSGGSGEPAPNTDTTEVAEDKSQFFVIKKSGTGWRKMWAGAAYRIEGYQSSFIIEVDPGIDELKKFYTHWAYPSNFNLATEAAKWQAESHQSDLGWCETKSPALCPCAYQPDIWTSGPTFEIYAGPFDTYEQASEARGDTGSNAQSDSAYQWLYSDGNYEDINNACAQIETGQNGTAASTGNTDTGSTGNDTSGSEPTSGQNTTGQTTDDLASTGGSTTTSVAPCHADSNLPVDAHWTFYRRIFGGGQSSYSEKGGHICYGSSYYYEYKGESMRGFDCDSNWENCVADPDGVYIYTDIETKENGDTNYSYSDGSAWGRRRPTK